LVDLILIEFHPQNSVNAVVKCEQQGRTSVTYQVIFNGAPSIIIQFRPSSRPLLNVAGDITLSRLGSILPACRPLKKFDELDMLVYEMNVLPGRPFSLASGAPGFENLLPSIATGLGNLLGKMLVLGSRTGDDSGSRLVIENHLRLAIESTDPRVSIHRGIYVQYLDDLLSGVLDELPLAVSNGDLSQTNVMVLYGMITGLADWEHIERMPIGYELVNIYWLMGTVTKDGYILRDNSSAIEHAFWTSFGAAIPFSVRRQQPALQAAMRISGAIRHCYLGWHTSWQVSLPLMANYTIPSDIW
jgi:hypothetical protein